MTRHTTCALLLAMVLTTPAKGQDNPRMIPTVLAAAVFSGFDAMGMSAHFVVGRAPTDWPDALLPGAPWKIVGGLEMGPMRVLAVEGPRSRDAVREYAALLTRAGMKESSGPLEVGGFTERSPVHNYCGDSTAVSLTSGDSTVRTRSLVVSWTHGESARSCGASGVTENHAPLDIPTLRAPTGVRANRTDSGWGRDHVEQSARVDTTLSVAAVLDHYARQLGSAGWTIGVRPIIDGGTGLQRLTSRDRKGDEWQGALVVITTGSQREVTLRMVRPAPDYTHER